MKFVEIEICCGIDATFPFKDEKEVAEGYKEITYRGRKLEVAREAAPAAEAASSTGTKRVYRGQVVNK